MSDRDGVPVNSGARCPRCGGEQVSVLVATAPRCLQCLACRHTWDEPALRPARDRRIAEKRSE